MAPGFAPTPPNPPVGDRTILLYFRGFTGKSTEPWGRANYTWSFGTRQELSDHFLGRFNETGVWRGALSLFFAASLKV